jgi:hypothetical protein
MSNNNIIIQDNKKLFETRLQMKQNSSLKIKHININTNTNNIKKKANLFLYNTEVLSGNISINQRKNQNRTSLENNSNNFKKKNISAEKKIKKLNKNKNRNNLINSSNKSNVIISDISIFNSRKTTIKNDIHQIINVNTKGSKNINSRNKVRKNNSNKKSEEVLNINNKRQENATQNKFSLSYMYFTNDNNNMRIISNDKQISSKSKVTILDKNNKSTKKRNNSNTNKDKNIYKTFLVQKIKIIKKRKNPYLNNININSSKIDKTTKEKVFNKTGKNIKDSIYKNCNEKFVRNTFRNLFIKKRVNTTAKNSFININKNAYANNSSLKNTKKISERNSKIKNRNKLSFNQNKKDINQNKINHNYIINRFKKKNETRKNLYKNQSKHNQTAKEIKSNLYNHNISDNKYIDKKEEIVDDFNIKSTKTNDEIFTEGKEEKIDESSVEEESGILSMNEIEDIIIYNNMKNINKEDNYLFNICDYNNFLSQYQQKISSIFFETKNNYEDNKTMKIYSEKKDSEKTKENRITNNKFKVINNPKEIKVLSYNNSIKKKKNVFFQK